MSKRKRRKEKQLGRLSANKTIFACLRRLGVKYSNMNMRQASEIVAKAYGIEVPDLGNKVMVAEAVRSGSHTITIPAGLELPARKKVVRTQKAQRAEPEGWQGSQKAIDAFYASWDWKRLRYGFLKGRERKCLCCAASADDGIRMVVDHIKPIRRFWALRLEITNLQVLCDDCNMGKGSRDETDWRLPQVPDHAEHDQDGAQQERDQA